MSVAAIMLGSVTVEANDPAVIIPVPGLHRMTDPELPGSALEDGTSWTGESNVLLSNDTRAVYSGTDQDWLQLKGFDLSAVPKGSRILGVEVTVEGFGDSPVDTERDIDVKLRLRGKDLGNTKTIRLPQTVDDDVIAGGLNDQWGVILVPGQIDHAAFEVWIRKSTALNNGVSLDAVEVTVHYTTAVGQFGQVMVNYAWESLGGIEVSLTKPGETAHAAGQYAQNEPVQQPFFSPWPTEMLALFAASVQNTRVTCRQQFEVPTA